MKEGGRKDKGEVEHPALAVAFAVSRSLVGPDPPVACSKGDRDLSFRRGGRVGV